MFCILKKKKYVQHMFQNKTQIVKNKVFFNDSKTRRMAFYCSKTIICIIKRKTVRTLHCLNCLNYFRAETKLLK